MAAAAQAVFSPSRTWAAPANAAPSAQKDTWWRVYTAVTSSNITPSRVMTATHAYAAHTVAAPRSSVCRDTMRDVGIASGAVLGIPLVRLLVQLLVRSVIRRFFPVAYLLAHAR